MRRAVLTVLALVLACATSVGTAAAQTRDPPAAEALFDEARRLMKEGRYAEACASFEASERLDPGVGTLLNLGDCLERAGRTASAWARFREAASAAALRGQDGREREARSRAEALERRLHRLVVRVPPAPPGSAPITVERDGIVIEPQSWGSALPIDPGSHVLVVRAPHHRPSTKRFEIPAEAAGGTHVVEVPALAAEELPREPSHGTQPPAPITDRRPSAQRTVGLAIGGASVIALGIAGVLAFRAKDIDDDARSRCDASGCSAGARDDARHAGVLADGATVSLLAAGALAAAAVVVFVTAPSSRPPGAARVPSAVFTF